MQADEALVSYIASTYYDITPILGSIKQLLGYDDRNFVLTDSADNKTYVLKIVNRHESIPELANILDEVIWGAYEYCQAKASLTPGHFIVPRTIKTTGNKLSTFTSVKHHKLPSTAAAAAAAATTTTTTSTTSDKPTVLSKPQQPVDKMEESLNIAAQTSPGDASDFEEVKCNIRMCEYFDGFTMFDYITGTNRSKPGAHSLEKLYFRLGKLCNQLFVYLRTQVHLTEKLKVIRGQGVPSPWVLKTCEKSVRANLDHLYPKSSHSDNATSSESSSRRRALVERTLDEFLSVTLPKLNELPEFILHSDLSNRNILLCAREQLDKICLIDFQDLQVGQQIIELTTMMLYNILDQEGMFLDLALRLIPRWIYAGYQAGTSCPLDPRDMALAPSLMKMRLCQSLLNGLMAIEREPGNVYVMNTNQRGWKLLELMSDASSPLGNTSELINMWLPTTANETVVSRLLTSSADIKESSK